MKLLICIANYNCPTLSSYQDRECLTQGNS
jgi:hypothetical protein